MSAENLRFITHSLQGVEFKMTRCPAGSFWMGSDETIMIGQEQRVDHQPRRRVKITTPFWIGQTSVTQALWEAVMDYQPSRYLGALRPVESVSWFEMARFCNQLSVLQGLSPAYHIGPGEAPLVQLMKSSDGYRMPTEAEWEYAAKANTELRYAGSDQLEEVAWFKENSGGETRPVAQKKPNAWGLYDMSGNVDDWCQDQGSLNDEPAHSLGDALVGDALVDPCHDTASFAVRVFRGGCWRFGPEFCRVALRSQSTPDVRGRDLGGRLVRTDLSAHSQASAG